ncbi:glycosyltransferase family 4 protein [Oceanirhabdus seepicola]|uniref:Glycosyltransferase family 4 protein n=1 Tax=Oceanirhabdus seepicola TaxID=2828781 RepID=A0A9J6P4F8_9CLOT|nr:glycosyltransferase family 4 protein [Oceanirhabdus seepicola]MCM1990504.1 glycosyltransferase family 4 protein [Oceanirhabdus seepicola]
MKKKICIIAPNINLKGGIATVIREYKQSHILKEFDLKYVSTYSNNRLIEFSKGLYHYMKMLVKKQIDLVHVHTASKGSFYRKSIFVNITPKNIPVILHIHGGGFIEFYDTAPIIIKKRVQKVIKRSDKIIVLSEKFKNELIDRFDIDNIKIVKVINGIKLNNEKIKLEDKKLQVIYLGKLTKNKGIYDLLQIIPKIHAKYPEVKFIIAGDGDIDKVKEIVISEEINNCTQVVGWIDGETKKKFLIESSILVMPSYFEAFGISIVEAMDYGMAVVATKVGGIPEIIQPNKNGLLFESGDLKEFSQALEKYISDNKARAKVQKNNLVAVEQYDINNVINQIKEIYLTI